MRSEIEYLVIELKERLKGAEQTADFIIVTKQYIESLETGLVEQDEEESEMDTITIEKFKKLMSWDEIEAPSEIDAPFGGRFGISMEAQKAQCRHLKVGDTVFFLDATYRGLSEDNKPEVDIVIKQAMLVEEE